MGSRMFDEGFASSISEVVARHPALALSIQVEESHFAKKNVTLHLMSDEFHVTWERYNDALFDTLRRMVRYERSVLAWATLLDGVADIDLKNTITADYVDPVFRVLADLPIAFKDQIIRGSVELSVFKTDKSPFETIDGIKQGGWYTQFKNRVASDPASGELPALVNDGLYGSPEAERLRDLHGLAMHDVSSSLVEGRPFVERCDSGIVAFGVEAPLKIADELEGIKSQRLFAQKTYDAFDLYVRSLECKGVNER